MITASPGIRRALVLRESGYTVLMRMCALVVLLGCSCSGSISYQDAPEAMHRAICEWYVRCGEAPDLGTCLAANVTNWFSASTSDEAAIAMGKIKYSGDDMSQCVAEIANLSCDTTTQSYRAFVNSPACFAVEAGTVHAGGACATGGECISQNCDNPGCPFAAACCSGTCVGDTAPQLGAVGQPCGSLGQAPCVDGAFCSNNALNQGWDCVALAPAGSRCGATWECAYGLGCPTTTQTCETLPTLGQACPGGVCRDFGTSCMNGICTKVGGVGATCATDNDCEAIYRCGMGGTCEMLAALGAACTGFYDCADYNAHCATTGCQAPSANGATCAQDLDCQSNYCDVRQSNKVCADQPVCI
jgi:hypothetical protein